MDITASAVAKAYATAARTISGADKNALATPGADAGAGDDFGAMVRQAVEQTSTALGQAESASLAHATGRADIVDVVTAVAETEVTLRTLVTVRDRVIAAYQDIMRMPI